MLKQKGMSKSRRKISLLRKKRERERKMKAIEYKRRLLARRREVLARNRKLLAKHRGANNPATVTTPTESNTLESIVVPTPAESNTLESIVVHTPAESNTLESIVVPTPAEPNTLESKVVPTLAESNALDSIVDYTINFELPSLKKIVSPQKNSEPRQYRTIYSERNSSGLPTLRKIQPSETTNSPTQRESINLPSQRDTFTNRPRSNTALKRILVATSIAPVQIEKQRAAINTWLEAGFDVVSLNVTEEVEQLKPHFPDIQFEVIGRSAIGSYGKPYIYIYDFMQYLIAQDYDVMGVINSDIHFKGISGDFLNFIYKHAKNSLVYGHRTDVTDLNDQNGTVSNGVDYFFFNKRIAAIYEDEGLCMGQPAWDWWMVCVPAAKRMRTKRLLSNNAYHIIHPQAWDQNLNQYLIETIVLNKHLKQAYPNLSPMALNTKMWDIVITNSGIRY